MSIYIDPDWAGTESGTEAEPYNSWASMLTGEAGWSAGETYLQKCGTTASITTPLSPNVNNVTISAYSTGNKPIIQQTGSAQQSVITFSDVTGYTVSDIEIKWDGVNGLTTSAFRNFQTSSTDVNALIDNVHVSSVNADGSDIKGITGTNANYITLQDCEIENIGADPIYFTDSDYISIYDCYIHDFDQDVSAGDGIHLNLDCNYWHVKGNTIIFDSGGPKGCIVSSGTATNGYNVFEDNYLSGGHWAISTQDKNAFVRRNHCVNQLDYCVEVGEDSLIHSNIFDCRNDASIRAVRYSSHMDVVSTTYSVINNIYMMDDTSSSICFGPNGSYTVVNNPTIIFKNNICNFAGPGGRYAVIYGSSVTVEMDYNLYYGITNTPRWTMPGVGNNSNLAQQQADGYDANSYEGTDPLIDANFRPANVSSCYKLGTPTNVCRDYAGNPLSIPPTIGAYEMADVSYPVTMLSQSGVNMKTNIKTT